jgi:hypothetical protein
MNRDGRDKPGHDGSEDADVVAGNRFGTYINDDIG